MTKVNSIFIVDDDPITVFGIRKILNSIVDCNQIETFGNGKLAIDAIKNILENNGEIPEIIFLDINMPIMDGWQFMEEFINLPIEMRVRINVITSSIATADLDNWENYRKKTHHIVDYANKPVKRSEITKITKPA
ncbi:response regulator [Aurantibacter crassamenti]|uniref:response regulator transcription factor n=1 Tax=Aurantibacter crassamenti TaxID=1837375 RepID=UPI00193A994B|nr:response regulator [Aurantibacter crassamenti]MBM1108011.1 response regulator [Aurantibacter crassamenti]